MGPARWVSHHFRTWRRYRSACGGGWRASRAAGRARHLPSPRAHGFQGHVTAQRHGIAEEIEAVGGELNAATSLETTAYFARTLKATSPSPSTSADTLQTPRYAEDELGASASEPCRRSPPPGTARRDRLRAVAGRGVSRACIGRPILAPSRASRAWRGGVARLPRANYGATRMVLSAGRPRRLTPSSFATLSQFGPPHGGVGGRIEPALYVGGTRTSAKPVRQSHLVMAFAGPSYRRRSFNTAQVSRGCFGGACRRAVPGVRERRGLCYAIYRPSGRWPIRACLRSMRDRAGGNGEADRVVGAELVRAAATTREAELARFHGELKPACLWDWKARRHGEQMARQLLLFAGLPPPSSSSASTSVTLMPRELAAKRGVNRRPRLPSWAWPQGPVLRPDGGERVAGA